MRVSDGADGAAFEAFCLARIAGLLDQSVESGIA
jgi:hypothetical protein